ncbi:MAG: low molecular weight protein tyrosine phosphatase family protein [Beijerinckiaceae bacterium]
MKSVLFLCARNRLRSPTAENIFSHLRGFEVSSAGINSDADNPVTGEMIEEADIIFVMEKSHRQKLQKRFQRYLRKARVICLDIPDEYEFMDPQLVDLLNKKVTPHLR